MRRKNARRIVFVCKNHQSGINDSISDNIIITEKNPSEVIMNLKKSKTYENLARSYAGECQAYVRYKFIEYGARKQGLACLAEMIDNVAFNEFQHARMFYTFIQQADKNTIDNIDICGGYPFKEKWDLTENLRFAAEDEENEETNIYPTFARIAREEGFDEIAALYDNIIQVESCHKKLFTDLYEQLKNGTLYKKQEKVKWKCADCGYEAEGYEPWTKCPICEAEQGRVMLKLTQEQE